MSTQVDIGMSKRTIEPDRNREEPNRIYPMVLVPVLEFEIFGSLVSFVRVHRFSILESNTQSFKNHVTFFISYTQNTSWNTLVPETMSKLVTLLGWI